MEMVRHEAITNNFYDSFRRINRKNFSASVDRKFWFGILDMIIKANEAGEFEFDKKTNALVLSGKIGKEKLFWQQF